MQSPPLNNNSGLKNPIVARTPLTYQPDLFESECNVDRPFYTRNPRHLRVIKCLMKGLMMREEVDKVARASNGPDLISELRKLGLEVPCERLNQRDYDGLPCQPGRYSFTANDAKKVAAFLEEFCHAECSY